jgi:hypothetical protein
MLFPLILFFSATAVTVPDFARVSARDYEDFETCYGSFEGAEAVLPQLRGQMPPNDFAAVEHAMQNLADDFAGLEMRLSTVIFGADRNDLARAHMVGRLPWQQPENRTLDYWSRNGPMSLFCFGLTKRLDEDLPSGF